MQSPPDPPLPPSQQQQQPPRQPGDITAQGLKFLKEYVFENKKYILTPFGKLKPRLNWSQLKPNQKKFYGTEANYEKTIDEQNAYNWSLIKTMINDPINPARFDYKNDIQKQTHHVDLLIDPYKRNAKKFLDDQNKYTDITNTIKRINDLLQNSNEFTLVPGFRPITTTPLQQIAKDPNTIWSYYINNPTKAQDAQQIIQERSEQLKQKYDKLGKAIQDLKKRRFKSGDQSVDAKRHMMRQMQQIKRKKEENQRQQQYCNLAYAIVDIMKNNLNNQGGTTNLTDNEKQEIKDHLQIHTKSRARTDTINQKIIKAQLKSYIRLPDNSMFSRDDIQTTNGTSTRGLETSPVTAFRTRTKMTDPYGNLTSAQDFSKNTHHFHTEDYQSKKLRARPTSQYGNDPIWQYINKTSDIKLDPADPDDQDTLEDKEKYIRYLIDNPANEFVVESPDLNKRVAIYQPFKYLTPEGINEKYDNIKAPHEYEKHFIVDDRHMSFNPDNYIMMEDPLRPGKLIAVPKFQTPVPQKIKQEYAHDAQIPHNRVKWNLNYIEHFPKTAEELEEGARLYNDIYRTGKRNINEFEPHPMHLLTNKINRAINQLNTSIYDEEQRLGINEDQPSTDQTALLLDSPDGSNPTAPPPLTDEQKEFKNITKPAWLRAFAQELGDEYKLRQANYYNPQSKIKPIRKLSPGEHYINPPVTELYTKKDQNGNIVPVKPVIPEKIGNIRKIEDQYKKRAIDFVTQYSNNFPAIMTPTEAQNLLQPENIEMKIIKRNGHPGFAHVPQVAQHELTHIENYAQDDKLLKKAREAATMQKSTNNYHTLDPFIDTINDELKKINYPSLDQLMRPREHIPKANLDPDEEKRQHIIDDITQPHFFNAYTDPYTPLWSYPDRLDPRKTLDPANDPPNYKPPMDQLDNNYFDNGVNAVAYTDGYSRYINDSDLFTQALHPSTLKNGIKLSYRSRPGLKDDILKALIHLDEIQKPTELDKNGQPVQDPEHYLPQYNVAYPQYSQTTGGTAIIPLSRGGKYRYNPNTRKYEITFDKHPLPNHDTIYLDTQFVYPEKNQPEKPRWPNTTLPIPPRLNPPPLKRAPLRYNIPAPDAGAVPVTDQNGNNVNYIPSNSNSDSSSSDLIPNINTGDIPGIDTDPTGPTPPPFSIQKQP